jgi:hypothetical protein
MNRIEEEQHQAAGSGLRSNVEFWNLLYSNVYRVRGSFDKGAFIFLFFLRCHVTVDSLIIFSWYIQQYVQG